MAYGAGLRQGPRRVRSKLRRLRERLFVRATAATRVREGTSLLWCGKWREICVGLLTGCTRVERWIIQGDASGWLLSRGDGSVRTDGPIRLCKGSGAGQDEGKSRLHRRATRVGVRPCRRLGWVSLSIRPAGANALPLRRRWAARRPGSRAGRPPTHRARLDAKAQSDCESEPRVWGGNGPKDGSRGEVDGLGSSLRRPVPPRPTRGKRQSARAQTGLAVAV
jgi:hypothetical protein